MRCRGYRACPCECVFDFCDYYLFDCAKWAEVVHKACLLSVVANIKSNVVSQGNCLVPFPLLIEGDCKYY